MVEQLTLNQWAQGSSPWRCTNNKKDVLSDILFLFSNAKDYYSILKPAIFFLCTFNRISYILKKIQRAEKPKNIKGASYETPRHYYSDIYYSSSRNSLNSS